MERRGTVSKRPLLLSNFLEVGGIHWLGASEPSKDVKRRLQVFRDDRSRRQSGALWPWKCAGSVVCWRLCSPWSCRSFLRPGDMVSLRPSSFLAPTGGVRNRVILLLPQTVTARSKTGQADSTISLDSTRLDAALCRHGTTSPWSSDYGGKRQELDVTFK